MLRVFIGAGLGYAAGAAYTTFTNGQSSGVGFTMPYFTTELKNYQSKTNLIGGGIGAALAWYLR